MKRRAMIVREMDPRGYFTRCLPGDVEEPRARSAWG